MSKYEVFCEFLPSIQRGIQLCVCEVTEKCYQRGMIAESVRQSVVYGVKTPGEKTLELLSALGDQIKIDEQLGQTPSESRFDKFVEILEEYPVHKNLAILLRNECKKLLETKMEPRTAATQQTDEELPHSNLSASSQLAKDSKVIHVDSGVLLELSSTDDSVNTQSTTVLSSTSDLAGLPEHSTSMVQQFQQDALVPKLDTATKAFDKMEEGDLEPVEETELDASSSALVVENQTLCPLEKKLLEAASEARKLHYERDQLEYERDLEAEKHEKKLMDIESKISELQTENERLKCMQDCLDYQLLITEQQLKETKVELEETKLVKDTEARNHKEDTNELEAVILEKKKQIEHLQQELKLQQTLQETNEQINEVNVAYIDECEQKLRQEVAQKDEAEQELSEIRTNYNKEEARYCSLIEQLKAEKSRLEKARDELKDKAVRIESQMNDIKRENDELQRANVLLQAQVTDNKQERDQFQKLYVQQKQTIDCLEFILCWCAAALVCCISLFFIMLGVCTFFLLRASFTRFPTSPDHLDL